MKVYQKNVININMPSIHLFASCRLFFSESFALPPNSNIWNIWDMLYINAPIPFKLEVAHLCHACHVKQHLICWLEKQREP